MKHKRKKYIEEIMTRIKIDDTLGTKISKKPIRQQMRLQAPHERILFFI
ncbi:MAG: hypothetical protein ACFE94_05235 [Candidatus Hodarchaeota archaeon]